MDEINPDLQQKCEACRAGAPQVSDAELAELMRAIPDWTPIVVDGVLQLQRVYAFRNFAEAWAMSNRVATLAEEVGHHPALLLEWGRLTVTWWSHKIRGLHRMDFELAAKTDRLLIE
ncbi:4a-hydroxytetrahydrobiopterin dehydratase [Chitinibacter bivalviorum]|uniref:Putative pterin-4-alpha-carbinolamine dehydratase n=1 Tax=Chitinibacter bivalviorum TaxID=2739434 RepID=A0A7H9BL70_9NEIS|nr:4a-hydroxytetrahydrobiopterin dehydratase [Chitinibacter bivalviorum]QLG88761.1 4a-hydroxytetrahydrobiopterin dehydratase [Chitinibacter bivalviorum]